jgi:hypothetical protein
MSTISVGRSTIVHKDDFAYISHPSIAVLSNGDWLAAFNHSRRRQPYQHPPSDPLFRTLLARSSDQGQHWSAPWFAPDFDWYGTECPGIAQLRDGTVVLTQFRFAWYPLGLAEKLRAEGVSISIKLPGKGWTEEFSERDLSDAEHTWARGYHGLYAHLSADGGDSFSHTTKMGTGPYLDGYTRTGVIHLADGRLAYAVAEHPIGRNTYILFSGDGGSTWNPPVLIVDSPDGAFSEPDIAEVASDELYCILRSERPISQDVYYLHGSRSVDGGKTWSAPAATAMDGIPGHLLVLADGRLLCTYARRRAPFGIYASLSEDAGRTWKVDEEIVIRDDLPNRDLGYPTTIEYEPGKLFVCYYGQELDGVTCVQGAYLDIDCG